MAVQNQRVEPSLATKTNLDDKKKPKVSPYVDAVMVISNFCRETSVHGLGQVVKHTVIVAKFVWLVAFFCAVIGNAYHISTLVDLYLEYPIQEVTKTQRSPISFPGVTICNLDAISMSNYESLLRNKSSRLSRYVDELTRLRMSGLMSDAVEDKYLTITEIQINIGMEEAKAIGHQIDDLILRCTFRGKPCNITANFKWMMNAVLYNCYTFDPGDMGDSFLATGAENGLSLILYLEANNGTRIHAEYDGTLNGANSLGVKVIVHPRHTYPNPHIDGMDIMPGHSTSIAFKLTQTKKLPPPHGDCIYNQSLPEIGGYDYSTTLCLGVCLQRRYVNICGCKSVLQPMLHSELNEPYCGTLYEDENFSIRRDRVDEEEACRKSVWLEFSGNQEIRNACKCKPRCIDYIYTYTVTESRWPATKYHESFIEHEIELRNDRWQLKAFTQLRQFIDKNKNLTHYHSNIDFISENFARLNVYLRQEESLVREQKPAYPISNLFSDIGGTLGLWVGLSLLTIIELMQLGVRMTLVLTGLKVE